jgi:hypothetical protein
VGFRVAPPKLPVENKLLSASLSAKADAIFDPRAPN